MKKVMMFVGLACLFIAAGCSQTSQAKPNQNKAADQQKQASANKDETSSLDWDSFSKKASEEKGEQAAAKDAKASMTGVVPAGIKIPAINVEANVKKKGKNKNGNMKVPQNYKNVGWYTAGAKPGEQGSAILAGHVDSQNGPAVFFNLKDLKKGDIIYINSQDGKQQTFKVYKKKAYSRNDAPINKIFGYTAAKTVKLLTCTGDFNYKADTHQKRLAVSAHLVDENKK